MVRQFPSSLPHCLVMYIHFLFIMGRQARMVRQFPSSLPHCLVMYLDFFSYKCDYYYLTIVHRGYYTAARRYEFYFRVVKTIFYEPAQRVSKILF